MQEMRVTYTRSMESDVGVPFGINLILPRTSSGLVPKIPNVVWTIVWVPGRFNKYRFVKPHIPLFSTFDVVLLKDADQRIAGFLGIHSWT